MTFSFKTGSFEHPLMADGVKHLLESIEDGIFVLDINLHVVYFNQPARQHLLNFYNFICEIGDPVLPLLPDDRRSALEYYFRRVLNGESIRYIHEIPKDNSNSIWVDCHYFPLKDHLGNIICIGGMLKDISERRIYRLKLEEKSMELTSILESITDGFFTLDRNWTIRYANNQAGALVGLKANDALGKNIKELFPNPSTATFFDAYQKAFDTGQPVRVEGYFSPLDKWLDVTIYPTRDQLTVYGRDVTEKKKLEQKLLELKLTEQKMVIKATIQGQEKERELLSTELHDNISQVLTTTKLYLEMAASNNIDKPHLIKKSVDNLTSAINDLRLISYSLLPSTINDIGIVDSIKELVQPYKAAEKFNVHYDFEGEWMDLSSGFKVNLFRIIQERLQVIAINSGASNVWIQLRSGNQFELSIKDDGKEKEQTGVTELHFATIRNRTELYDGIATISTYPQGCQVLLRFPYESCK